MVTKKDREKAENDLRATDSWAVKYRPRSLDTIVG